MLRCLRTVAATGCLCGAVCAADDGDLLSRRPLPKTRVAAHLLDPDWPGPRPDFRYRLVVKFVDEARVRSDGIGGIASLSAADLAPVREVAARHGLSFAPLIDLEPSRLVDLEQRAAQRSGRAQPDLAGVHAATGTVDATELFAVEAAGSELLVLDVVEFAYVETLGCPPPGDVAPPTPDLVSHQTYREPDPGIDADFAWSLGLRGTGLRLSDCEYNWNAEHEDLVDIDLHLEPGQTPHPTTNELSYTEHGTAVLGETSAPDNGYGVTGMATGAEVHTYPEWTVEGGFRRVECIASAIADSAAGDVVMLEMQQIGAGNSYGPAELDPAVWMVTRTGADAGVVVVAAAGNGNQDLDHWLYAPYAAMGHSGAIIVGGGDVTTLHPKFWDSTYGSRLDLQGWCAGVFTLGYGGFATYGDDVNQAYTAGFSGTSAATPFVASACLLVQERAVTIYGAPFGPAELRDVLVDTAIPQVGGFPVGDFPDLRAALDRVAWKDLGHGLAGTHGEPVLTGDGLLEGNTPFTLVLEDALALQPAYLVVGYSALFLPVVGGTLVPDPSTPGQVISLVTDSEGGQTWLGTWPTGVPSGTDLYLQAWVLDPAGTEGFAASNALAARTL